MKTGIELIAQERQEQIEKHGRTIEKDVTFNECQQLCEGAIALLTTTKGWMPLDWDKATCEKMLSKTYKERLIIAGALIAAEIDRLQFIDSTPTSAKSEGE